MDIFSFASLPDCDIFCTFQYCLATLILVLPAILREYAQTSLEKETHKAQKVIIFHNLILKIGNKLCLEIVDEIDKCKQLLTGNLCSCVSYVTDFSVQIKDDKLHLTINGNINLIISHVKSEHHHQYVFTWKRKGFSLVGMNCLEDCFCLLDAHWYGAGHVFQHFWPLNKWNTNIGPFVTGEGDPLPFATSYYGGIQERMWICSTGVGLYVEKDVPLFVSINHDNDGKLKLQSKFSSPFSNPYRKETFLKYHICVSRDIKDISAFMRSKFLQIPVGVPCEDMFRYPIWSTWAEFKTDINQDKVLQFAQSIREYGFEAAQLEIDDDWTPHYGQMEFDIKKFPSPSSMVKELKDMGFKVSIWIHPYVSPYADNFKSFSRLGFLLKGFLNLPSLFKWWNGYASLIDFTNEEASQTYLQSLEALKRDHGIDTFKIDAGEVWNFSSYTKSKKTLTSPNEYSTIFAEIAAQSDTKLKAQEIRVAYQNQSLPMFFRLQDKDSNWGYFNGIRTVIPHVLTFGLLGYPFILPDMIGGNGHSSKELLIRWIQLNTLMPAMQFSIAPWKYDPEVIVITRRMLNLRKKYSEKIIQLARDATVTGDPICRPLWWIDTTDEIALTIDSEFLLGDDILVAPVLENGERYRDIYLPNGKWKDEVSKEIYEGGKWIRNYYTGLVDLPHFSRYFENK